MRAPTLLALLCAACTCKEPLDPAKAEAELKKGCAAGKVDACVALGDLYAQPDTKLDGPLLPTRKKTCAMGSGLGCRKLGELLRDGDYPHRVNVDPSGATAAFERGCKLGDGLACFAHGKRLENGQGAGLDVQAAAFAYLRGCELGERAACDVLDAMLERRKASLESAGPTLFARACDAGVSRGCAP